MTYENLVKGLTAKSEYFLRLKLKLCNPCIFDKIKRCLFSSSRMEAKNYYELIHRNIVGPMFNDILEYFKYVRTFVDKCLIFCKVVSIKHKNHVLEMMKVVLTGLKRQIGKQVPI